MQLHPYHGNEALNKISIRFFSAFKFCDKSFITDLVCYKPKAYVARMNFFFGSGLVHDFLIQICLTSY